MRNIKNTPKNKIAGIALMSNSTVPKHKIKSKSNVPTSDIRHLTSNTAITLIALVITIIVLLILAGITLTAIMGPNGIINKAKKAREETELKTVQEELELIITEAKTELITEGKTNPDSPEIAEQIRKTKNETIKMDITFFPTAQTTGVNINYEYITENGAIGPIKSVEIEYKGYRFILDGKFRIQKEESKKLSEIKTSTITYNLNGGEGDFPEKELETGRKLPKEEPTKQGYAFIGWNTKEDGSRKNIQSRSYMGRRTRHNTICDVECNII